MRRTHLRGLPRRLTATLGVLTLAISMAATPVAAKPGPPRMLQKAVTVEGIREHQQAFQDIADANGGNRAVGTPGYEASADYVTDTLSAAGYDVTRQPFTAAYFVETTPSELEQVEPDQVTYDNATTVDDITDADFATLEFSGSGDATAPVTAVDLDLGLGNESDSGCSTDAAGNPVDEDDFADFPAGDIALIQRGTCTFGEKVANAEAAGAVGVVIFNQGEVDEPDRQDLFFGTLGADAEVTIPAVSVSYDLGAEFAQTDGLVLRIAADTTVAEAETVNVLAETPGGRDDNVVVAGAHLDSVQEGPGINDNGSGIAVLMEVAEKLARFRPNNKVRFAFWGAEEVGLIGSTFYVADLAADHPDELDDIALYLNFDMVGSPNYVRFVYDGDGDAFGLPGPQGSAYIERFFERHFAKRGLASKDTEFSGRSDYAAFIAAGIPAGGLFTGAEGIKTEEEAQVYGGTAGEPYDSCYHLACDTYDNVSLRALNEMSNAIAHAVAHYARKTTPVNGVTNRAATVQALGGADAPGALHRGHRLLR